MTSYLDLSSDTSQSMQSMSKRANLIFYDGFKFLVDFIHSMVRMFWGK